VEQLELFERLAVALVIGVLIGVERGWQERTAPEGSRIACWASPSWRSRW
jgi:uncharacterized membrane protein YhiD involved in acid resistance